MGHLGLETCSVHLISTQTTTTETSQEGIKCITKAKELLIVMSPSRA